MEYQNNKRLHISEIACTFVIFISILVTFQIYIRPWHDAWAIAHSRAVTCPNQEKGGLGGQ